jgi:hypothetical protein
MSSGTIVPMILEKENAVLDFRTLIGATDPAKADEGTIRKIFAKSLSANAIHGSDSDENATLRVHFSSQLLSNTRLLLSNTSDATLITEAVLPTASVFLRLFD